MRYHYIPIRIIKIKRLTTPSIGKDIKEQILTSHWKKFKRAKSLWKTVL